MYKGSLLQLVPTVHSPKPPFLLHLLACALEPIHEQSRVFPLFWTKYQLAMSQDSEGVGRSVGTGVVGASLVGPGYQ